MRFCLRIIPILLLAFSFLKCKTESSYQTILKEYERNSDSVHRSNSLDSFYFPKGKSMSVIRYNDKKVVREINGLLLEKSYGHYFKFDVYGTLYKYEFRVGDGAKHYSYGVRYINDSIFYSEVGSPFVDSWRDESIDVKDSMKLVCLFSMFPRQKVKVLVSINGVEYNSIPSKKSPVMPFLEEVELTLPLNTKRVFFQIETDNLLYGWKGLLGKRNFLDSLSL